MIISFGYTSDRLHQKTQTRRIWKPVTVNNAIKNFENNSLIKVYDKGAFAGGKHIGDLRLIKLPYQQKLAEMPESDVIKEGFPELSKSQFIHKFFDGNDDLIVTVLDFHFTEFIDHKPYLGIQLELF